ncbi:MAG: NAD(P)H-dependent oxidoreductase [Akkermansiaceae bacterium]|nr:NAD(P)H-dependent oxidoreductase [Akkermansiaceae bacterium]
MELLSPSDLVDHLNWRYAVKVFDPDRRIPPASWTALEQSLVLAPSSFGMQPWKFLVLTDRALRESLVEHSWGQRQVVDCSHFVVFAAPTNLGPADVDRFADRTTEVRDSPPGSLDGFRKMVKGFLANFDEEQRLDWACRQIYLALGQLMTSAAVLGIDTCPMEGFSPPDYDRILGLPDQNLTAAVCCGLGYRGEGDKYATLPKVRYPTEEVVEVR